jgi:D-alanine-D-alanine ligase
MSQVSGVAIKAVLTKHFASVGETIIDSASDLAKLLDIRPDLVFLGMECTPSDPKQGAEDPNMVWLSEFLDAHDIAYTGSGKQAHQYGRDKSLAKQHVRTAGLATADYQVIPRHQPTKPLSSTLGFPLFVKPTNRGGGLGIDAESVVRSSWQLKLKVNAILADLDSDALVETYLPGREFSVAILKAAHLATHKALALELIAPKNDTGARILSGQVKSGNVEQALPVADKRVKHQVTAFALDVFRALGGRDYGRIDIRMDAEGRPHFLEANLIPSLIRDYGSFPKACVLNDGLDYESMILRIARLGLARRPARSQHQPLSTPHLTGADILPA